MCAVDAVCENTDGNYTCSCNPGYSGDGLQCNGVYCYVFHTIVGVTALYIFADIDECSLGSHGCINSQCVNGNGSYSCVCLTGFVHSDASNSQSPCGKL